MLQNPAITLSDLSIIKKTSQRTGNSPQHLPDRPVPSPIHQIPPTRTSGGHLSRSAEMSLPRKINPDSQLTIRLFQLELYYLFDGTKAVFIPHVPAVPQGSPPLAPPVPLIPDRISGHRHPANAALSDNPDLLSFEISYSDLMDCHHSNQFYDSEKHGILLNLLGHPLRLEMGRRHDLVQYGSRLSSRSHAPPHRQQVPRLLTSPIDITVVKNCAPLAAKDKAKQDFAKISITEIHVLADCTAQLNDHTIIVHSSIQIEFDIQHFEWNFSA